MRCPVCHDTELVEHIRDGIEVDRCPRCRGTWLERTELDKLLDLAEARSPEHRIAAPPERRPPDVLPQDQRPQPEGRHGERKRKRKGAFAEMLEDVFDVFD